MTTRPSAASPCSDEEVATNRRYKIQTESWSQDFVLIVDSPGVARWTAMRFETPIDELECGESTLCVPARRGKRPFELSRVTRVT